MAWSYNPADLNTTTASGRLNVVRLLVGDTETTDQQVQDEEITFALTESGNNVYYSGAWTSRAIASKYSRQVTTELSGALKAQYSDLAKQYKTLADRLDYQGKTSGAAVGILAGGMTKTSINLVRSNTDRVAPVFTMDQFDNPPSYQTPEYE